LQFLFIFQKICPKSIFFESFKWAIIHMDFVAFPFRTSKLKNNISYSKYKLSHRFGKVYRWLSTYYWKVVIITFFQTTTMSIWIIFKNLVLTHRDYKFYHFWGTRLCIHSIVNEGIAKINAFKVEWRTSTHFWNHFAIFFLDG
jgi:hypothetical protein